MSWLNSSLSTIKGQLTTLAQEVLSDTAVLEEDDVTEVSRLNSIATLEVLSDNQKQCAELNQICMDKDNEVTIQFLT